jgi:hypothetical protein
MIISLAAALEITWPSAPAGALQRTPHETRIPVGSASLPIRDTGGAGRTVGATRGWAGF